MLCSFPFQPGPYLLPPAKSASKPAVTKSRWLRSAEPGTLSSAGGAEPGTLSWPAGGGRY